MSEIEVTSIFDDLSCSNVRAKTPDSKCDCQVCSCYRETHNLLCDYCAFNIHFGKEKA